MAFHVVKQLLDIPTGRLILPDDRVVEIRGLALYHGKDLEIVGRVTKNLIGGLRTSYDRLPETGNVGVTTYRYQNGERKEELSYFELNPDNPVDSLVDASTSRFSEETELFRMLTPEEIDYIRAIQRRPDLGLDRLRA